MHNELTFLKTFIMKNKFLQILGTAGLVLLMGSSVTSCSVEDGIDGINGIDGNDGIDGVNGAEGADGADGTDGADAIGLEEFANYGSIELRVQGIRPDSVAFDYETQLEFISPELYANNFTDNDTDHDFYFLRLLDAPNVHEVNGVAIDLEVDDPGSTSESFSFEIEFSDFAIFSDDLTYILLGDQYSGSLGVNGKVPNNNVPNTLSISDYSFDDTTNNLKFSFSMVVDSSNSETGHNLTIDGTVDVILFENAGSND